MAITPVKELVMRAKEEIETLSRDEVWRLAEAGEALVVDIRDPRELEREGKFPGALKAPRGMLEFWFDPASPYHKEAFATDKKIILFCAGAWRSSLATKALQDMGADNVAEMEGGFKLWKEEGRAVEL
mgnify:CR=1 FL=1